MNNGATIYDLQNIVKKTYHTVFSDLVATQLRYGLILEPALQGVGRRGVGNGNLTHKTRVNAHTNTLKQPELIIKISL